jgi:type II secretory ATPase GspE/PulE/Tfp pilus assembly ATPase PilB-like protein
MTTLRQDGLRRALAGTTTLEEVYRVTQDSVPIAEEAS